MAAAGLVGGFLARWKGRGSPDDDALSAELGSMYARGRVAWPLVIVAPAEYAGFVGERAPAELAAAAAAARLCAEDLYLACGCALGNAHAMAALNDRLLALVPACLSTLRLSAADIDETRQLLRQKLFVGDGGAPRILAYEGRGALESWLRVVATRTALNLLAATKIHAPLDDAPDRVGELVAPGDPELDYIKARYRVAFAKALRGSFKLLSERDRNLMRFQYLDRLTLEHMGSIYGVHCTTVHRWLAAAHEQMFSGTRALAREALGVSADECDSLLELVRSRLDVTLRSLLGAEVR